MKPADRIRTALMTLFLVLSAHGLAAQTQMAKPAPQQPSNCKDMPYLAQNKFSHEPIELSQVHGTVMDQNGVVLANVCIGIFSLDNRKLLRAARVDDGGTFSIDLKDLPDGTYRLMGYFIGFCPANAIITINSKMPEKKPLVVHMKLPDAPDCSTVEVKAK
jgi:hypothetical protein